jgi:RHS repeat-associated protein
LVGGLIFPKDTNYPKPVKVNHAWLAALLVALLALASRSPAQHDILIDNTDTGQPGQPGQPGSVALPVSWSESTGGNAKLGPSHHYAATATSVTRGFRIDQATPPSGPENVLARNQVTTQTGQGVARVTGTVAPGTASVLVNGLPATVGSGTWEAIAPVGVPVPVVATQTDFAPAQNAQSTTKTLTIPATPGPAKTFIYDLNGNMTSDGGTHTYEWDAANRLVAINYIGTNPAQRTEIAYDGQGRWVKIVEKSGTTLASEKHFIWEGMTLAEERDATNAVKRRYYPEGEEIDGVPYLYHRDHLGSVRELVTPSGTLVARYDYDPYGQRTKLVGGLEAARGFTGHYYHARSGLHLAPFRAYSAELGRWLSRDPIEEEGGINLYGYVGNDPVNWIDPDGLSPSWALPPQLAGGDSYSRDFQQGWYDTARWAPAALLVIPAALAGKALLPAAGLALKKCSAAKKPLMDQMSPDEAAKYRKYWEKHAPEASKPYDMYPRYTEDGRLKQMTTYDEFGDRHRQYDLIDPRRPEHQHNFDYDPLHPRPKGIRSDHLPIDE